MNRSIPSISLKSVDFGSFKDEVDIENQEALQIESVFKQPPSPIVLEDRSDLLFTDV